MAFRGEPFFGQDRLDVLLWRLFKMVHRRVLKLPAEVVRGKNLIAVGRKPAAAAVTPGQKALGEEPRD